MSHYYVAESFDKNDRTAWTVLFCVDCGARFEGRSAIVGQVLKDHKDHSGGRCV